MVWIEESILWIMHQGDTSVDFGYRDAYSSGAEDHATEVAHQETDL